MSQPVQRNGLRWILCAAILSSSFATVHADEPTSQNRLYHQEVRERLARLQSNLDLLFANHQLSANQYQAESERVRQLRLQMHVDTQEHEALTQDQRNTDMSLIEQINQEATQWAVANSSSVPAGNPTSAPAAAPIPALPTATTPPAPDLKSQYADLNTQYQNVTAQYKAATAANDFHAAQDLRTQLEALRQRMQDLQAKMAAPSSTSPPANP